jgi:hypothetical protein
MTTDPTTWPEPTAETRPWTRWWWLGAAVDRETITRLLQEYHETGLGGVEITSIYGVKGQEHQNIEYLSPKWLDMVKHAIAVGHRLGMKVDLPPGSGWRIGGSFITDDVAAANLSIEETDAESGYRAESTPSGALVKRAGPGGTGKSFNPFSRSSLQAVIDHFTPAFKELGIRPGIRPGIRLGIRLGIRAQFHDSWEYTSDSCPEIFDSFRAKRGYDLNDHLRELAGKGDDESNARVKYDLRLTLAEMALEAFIIPWTEWCHELGQLSRNQAHGSPGNLLDLYAAADIPETEVFRGVTPDTPLFSKFASSAAHVAGKPLVSSETCTWLKEHFHVSLADAKILVDNLFVSGINHHVYHGTAYSPDEAAWPGWLFYASTQFNPQNTIWRDFAKLNEYVTRCQSILQDGESDNDLLVYFPVHDVLHDPSGELARYLTIEGTWMRDTDAIQTFRHLWKRGYSFDYVSDRQIAGIKVSDETLVTAGATYRAIVVPPCQFMPVSTLETLVSLSRQGAPVVFLSPVPTDVPGLARLEKRRGQFNTLMAEIKPCTDVESALTDLGIRREQLVDCPGALFIRRRHPCGHHYFVVNQGTRPLDEWVALAVPRESVLLMDPMSGRTGLAQVRHRETTCQVHVQLQPGASCVLRTFTSGTVEAVDWPYDQLSGTAHELEGTWRVEFIEGGPELPAAYETDLLSSWTDRGGAAVRFAGTAVYRFTFDAPSEGQEWLLDLGEVHSSARVRLNGEETETLIGPSFKTALTDVKPAGNVLEVEVTNLAANRIRDLDRRGVEWRIFEDINFVNRKYEPFDASDWPLAASGLIGPVRLTQLKRMS